MKITEIKRSTENSSIFEVKLSPNFIERLFGIKEKTETFKDTGNEFYYTVGHVYVNNKGEILGPTSYIRISIDNYRRSF